MYCQVYSRSSGIREMWNKLPPVTDQQPPNMLQKTINFTKALAKHIQTGRIILPPEKSEERLNVCRSNMCGMFNGVNKCNHKKCGCNLKVKASWADQDCPMGLWPLTVVSD
jgi:hypothetical protein